MSDRVCLITGATRGIGFETARGLAMLGATTILVGRDRARSAAAAERIRDESNNPSVEFLVADLSSQRDVKALIETVGNRFPRFHVLINNAGLFTMRRALTVDGIEQQWAVNHLAYYMIAESLAGTLSANQPARIINVASSAHFDGHIDFDDLSGEQCYSGVRAYSQSKLANVPHAYDLASRMDGTGVTVNCLHPGTIRTGIAMNDGGIVELAVRIRGLFLPGPVEGARTSIYLASSPGMQNTSGMYFTRCAPHRSAARSYDRALQRRLRDVSAQMTGVPPARNAAQGSTPARP